MNLPLKEDIIDFVHNNYGEPASKNLKNIHQGGSNNQKGRDYENQFLLFKAFEIANKYEHDCNNQILESQTISFVDDICHIDYEDNVKYNYQAKNSSGEASKWTDETSDRFRKQRDIDIHLFKVDSSKNCLLVSDKQRSVLNKELIPDDLKAKDSCEYFKFHPNTYELIRSNTELLGYVSRLIGSQSISDCDYAVSLINGVLQSCKHNTIKDIFKQAESDANPNPFIKFRTFEYNIPNWVQQILTDHSHCAVYSLNYNKLMLDVNGIKVACNIDFLQNADEETVNKINDIKDLVTLIMLGMGEEIKRHLDSSEYGEAL